MHTGTTIELYTCLGMIALAVLIAFISWIRKNKIVLIFSMAILVCLLLRFSLLERAKIAAQSMMEDATSTIEDMGDDVMDIKDKITEAGENTLDAIENVELPEAERKVHYYDTGATGYGIGDTGNEETAAWVKKVRDFIIRDDLDFLVEPDTTSYPSCEEPTYEEPSYEEYDTDSYETYEEPTDTETESTSEESEETADAE